MSETRLILHIKGTEQDTTELPKASVRAAIARGEITHSQLIWSPLHNAWKQVRELPHLLPSQKMAPAPMPRVGTTTLPKVSAAPQHSAAVPRAAAQPKVRAQEPQVRAAAAATPKPSSSYVVVEEKKGFNPMKWMFIGLAGLIVLLLGGNYIFVGMPLSSHFSKTPYGSVGVYAHLGAFVQPSVVVIHVPFTSSVPRDHVTDFLVALAKSTPPSLNGDTPYERIALTNGWLAHYSFTGLAWKELGEMADDDFERRKDFILSSLADGGGNPLVVGNTSLNEQAQATLREKVWNDFVSHFSADN